MVRRHLFWSCSLSHPRDDDSEDRGEEKDAEVIAYMSKFEQILDTHP